MNAPIAPDAAAVINQMETIEGMREDGNENVRRYWLRWMWRELQGEAMEAEALVTEMEAEKL